MKIHPKIGQEGMAAVLHRTVLAGPIVTTRGKQATKALVAQRALDKVVESKDLTRVLMERICDCYRTEPDVEEELAANEDVEMDDILDDDDENEEMVTALEDETFIEQSLLLSDDSSSSDSDSDSDSSSYYSFSESD